MDMTQPPGVQASAHRQAALVWSPHPLIAGEGRVVAFDPPTGAESLQDYLTRLGVDLSGPVIVAVDRTVIPREWLGRVKPKPGTLISVRAAVAGDDGSQVVAIVAMIALMVAAPYLGMALATGLTGSSIAATTYMAGMALTPAMLGTAAVTVLGSMAISALTPRPKVDLGRAMSTVKESSTYSLAGGSNQARPYEPLGLTLGRHRVFFDLASRPYAVNKGEDQYIYQVFHVGMHGAHGSLRVEDLRIGNTPLSDYQDVTLEYATDAMPALMPYNVDSVAGGSVTVAGGPIIRTTSIDTTRIEVDMQFVAYRAGSKGLQQNTAVFQLEYRAVGGDRWFPLGQMPVPSFYSHYWSRGDWGQAVDWEGNPSGLVWIQTEFDVSRWAGAHTDGVDGWRWRPYSERPVSDPAPPDWELQPSAQMTVRLSQATPMRQTFYTEVGRGQYEVRCFRVTPDETDSNAVADITLTSVRSYQSQEGDFTGQCFLAVKVRASGQLNGTLSTISGIVSQPVAPGVYSSNPADLFLLFARGYRAEGRLVWGAGMADVELDLPAIAAWRAWCVANSLRCNLHIDSSKSVWDILQAICRCGRGSPSWSTGRLGVLWDAADQPVVAVFGPSNIKRGSFEVVYGSEAAADEITLTYVDEANDYQTDTVRVKAPGVTTPTKPAAIELWGCTSFQQAIRECRLQVAHQIYRVRQVSWVTDMEGLVVTRGDVVTLSHDLTQWGTSGRLVAGTTHVLQLDRAITLDGAGSWVTVVDPTGAMHTCRVQYQAGEVDSIALIDPLPVAPDSDNPVDWRWLADYQPTPGKRVKITDIRPTSMHEVRITAMDDPDEYYAAESGTYSPAPVRKWTSSDPTLSDLSFAEELVTAGAGYAVRLTVSWSETGYVSSRRVKYRIDDGTWIDLGLVDNSSVRLDVPDAGTVTVVVVGYDGAGQVRPSAVKGASHVIAGRYAPPPAVTGFAVSALPDGTRVVTWTVAEVPPDVGYIDVRYAASSATPWAAMTVLGTSIYAAGRAEASVPGAGTWTFEARLRDSSGIHSDTGLRVTVTLGAPPAAAVAGVNRLYNSSRRLANGNDDGWYSGTWASPGVTPVDVEFGAEQAGVWHLTSGASRYAHIRGAYADRYPEWLSWPQKLPVRPGQRLEAHALTGAHRGTVIVAINWLNGADSLIRQDVVGMNASEKVGGTRLEDWKKTGGFAEAPAGAVSAVFCAQLRDCWAADPYMFIDQCFLGEALPGQTELSPWSDGARTVTNTDQLVDGAGLGDTATWGGVSGAGKPEDNATVGAEFGKNISGKIDPGNSATYIDELAIGTSHLADRATTVVLQNWHNDYGSILGGQWQGVAVFDLLDEFAHGATITITSSGMLWPDGATDIHGRVIAHTGARSGSGLGLPWGPDQELISDFQVSSYTASDARPYSISKTIILAPGANLRVILQFSGATYFYLKHDTRMEVIKK
ncbi:host specificity factor TipJ family phage tail protein [uncultured Zoogloea sp.]|uniref:host specificity factor TipJ family phage tail protein n=1 Tax=uncultured Zoogloea sp. TaxID=160237 RepID=UPI0026280F36|nr:host specificity factor TipJ family phage tail protein [uncultured Zoogloea sp.]